ncbi:MAG: helix-turn-helix domain-containing protein [Calditrichaeota bacterium]|nr:MAG: helix-turn-helix domain-containing protein [Calditrichota bacterium]
MKKKLYTENEIAELLGISPITVQRWEHQGKIPFKTRNNKIYFNKNDILLWAKEHDIHVQGELMADTQPRKNPCFLSDAIERGGIYYNVAGNDVYSILKNALLELTFLKKADRGMLLNELLNREELASTGIGNGVAIPHTRNRLNLNLDGAHLPVLFTAKPVEYNAIDGVPVFALFMMFSTTTKEHLKLLSKISYVLQIQEILPELQKRNDDNLLIEKIRKIESESE